MDGTPKHTKALLDISGSANLDKRTAIQSMQRLIRRLLIVSNSARDKEG